MEDCVIDTLEQIRQRYPNQIFNDSLVVEQYDIFNLPFSDNSVDEIRSEGLIEHLPFIDEPRFFYEIERVLKPGGFLYLSTVDFEMAAKQWLDAPDDWKDFYRNDDKAILEQHWFGTYTYKTNKGSYPSKRVDPSLSRALSLYVSIRPLQTQSH